MDPSWRNKKAIIDNSLVAGPAAHAMREPRRSNAMGRKLRAPSCECLIMKLESLKVSDRSALLPGSSFGLSNISEGGARA
jgi:hypothetical protein